MAVAGSASSKQPIEVAAEDGVLLRVGDAELDECRTLLVVDGAMPAARENDESVPKSSRSGPAMPSADSNTFPSVRSGWNFTQLLELEVSKYTFGH